MELKSFRQQHPLTDWKYQILASGIIVKNNCYFFNDFTDSDMCKEEFAFLY